MAVMASVMIGTSEWRAQDTSMSGIPLRCALDLEKASDRLPGLAAGMNYEMLKDYSESQQDSLVSIVVSRKGESYLDSLKLGVVDLVVIPYNDTLRMDSISFSRPIEDITMWAIRSEYTDGLDILDRWIEEYASREGYEDRRDCFLLRFSPSRRAANGRKSSTISPYDETVRRYADTLGWDWRLLSAIIYQESKFHIEAVSGRGASGLMQVLPGTAGRFGVTDLLDPEENIKAGTALLAYLQDQFAAFATDSDELMKFVLAAYNAGRQRIMDCINFAGYKGVDHTRWDEVASIIPEMSDESAALPDTVKLGRFNGGQTLEYVQKVLSLYEDFKVICP